MTAASAALRGRRAAEALMLDTCTIGRPAGETYHADSDGYSQTLTAVYEGRCKVKPRDNADRVVDAGGETVSLFPFIVSIPMGAPPVDLDDVVTVTASALDPSLVGERLRVRQVTQGSFLTARRLSCEVQS